MRWTLTLLAFIAAFALAADTKPPAKSKSASPSTPKAGIKTPGVQIPFESLKPEAQFSVETPGSIAFAAPNILVANRSKDALAVVDLKTNKLLDPIANLHQPCSNIISAFGSLWIANCGSKSITRVDPKTSKITATLAIGATDALASLAASADSVWAFTDSRTTLSRIDPETNKVVDELRLPANCGSLAFGEGSLWVACPSETRILHINPATNLVDKRIEVAAGARAIAFGANSVWILCEKEGKIERIDPKTNKIVKTIDLMVPNAAGNLAFGDGFLCVTQTGFPLTRIDTTADQERVAQQFFGDAAGSIATSPGAIWLSNTSKGSVWRIDPKRVIATLAE